MITRSHSLGKLSGTILEIKEGFLPSLLVIRWAKTADLLFMQFPALMNPLVS